MTDARLPTMEVLQQTITRVFVVGLASLFAVPIVAWVIAAGSTTRRLDAQSEAVALTRAELSATKKAITSEAESLVCVETSVWGWRHREVVVIAFSLENMSQSYQPVSPILFTDSWGWPVPGLRSVVSSPPAAIGIVECGIPTRSQMSGLGYTLRLPIAPDGFGAFVNWATYFSLLTTVVESTRVARIKIRRRRAFQAVATPQRLVC